MAAEGWEVPRDSFSRIIFSAAEAGGTVRECLGDAQSRALVDVYCGVGFFAIELADLVENFLGVELDQLAIKAARRNAAARGRANGEFITGRAEELLPGLMERFPAATTSVFAGSAADGLPEESLALCAGSAPARSSMCRAIRRPWRGT